MKFYTDRTLIDINSLAQNVYDLEASSFYVSLLPKKLKYEFLSRLNPEALRAYTPILNIDDVYVETESECDFVLLPPCSSYGGFEEYMNQHQEYLSKAKKPVAIFYSSSDDRVFNVGTSIQLFRGGSYRSRNRDNIHGAVNVVADHYAGKLLGKELSVSFCGLPSNNDLRSFVIDKFNTYDYFDFIGRTKWGGDTENDTADRDSYGIGPSEKTKNEFIANMQSNLYSLVVRGTANVSYRLFESLMMGRIPVIVDTDMLLPFADNIPYSTNMVWVGVDDDYDSVLREFHDSHSEDELVRIQLENRSIWEKYFRADSAFYSMKKLLSETNEA